MASAPTRETRMLIENPVTLSGQTSRFVRNVWKMLYLPPVGRFHGRRSYHAHGRTPDVT
ncbi:hypothetical protein NBRC3293_0939 [Gluconobacter oxydans NBRC 3293]|uniref:Uncharacterized protein n=1 Tax=Gluconobacter oxydans NBRC 3293 TaxID=1315969 RepID=A0A829WZZ8_GLUOY|nr:hypothetical protein NBRC3293_0939 [Gluconobacter oxydans NBRC 3293]